MTAFFSPVFLQKTPVQYLGQEDLLEKGQAIHFSWSSLVAQLVKNLPITQDTLIRSLGLEDPLEKGKAAHSNILAWRIPWTNSPWGCKESDTTKQLSL